MDPGSERSSPSPKRVRPDRGIGHAVDSAADRAPKYECRSEVQRPTLRRSPVHSSTAAGRSLSSEVS